MRQRLLNRSHERREPFDLVLTRYALERLLYRLSRSPYRDEFVVNGATLLQVWTVLPHRPTRDLDLLGHGEESSSRMENAFREICALPGEDDGMEFDSGTVRSYEIREGQEYGGVRVTFTAHLAGARIPLQVDIGFGDVVTEGPVETVFPTLLGTPAPVLPAYSRESVVSEKYHALVDLGIVNTRMKDFFDLYVLSDGFAFQGPILAEAIRATFQRRRSALPHEVRTGLSDDFARDRTKRMQWTLSCARHGWREPRRSSSTSSCGSASSSCPLPRLSGPRTPSAVSGGRADPGRHRDSFVGCGGGQKRPKPLSLLRLKTAGVRGHPGHRGPAGSRPMSNVNKGGDLLSENNAAFDLARANDRRVGA